MLWPCCSAALQEDLKVCRTFEGISKVQTRNRRIWTRCWFPVQHPRFYKYAHPCACSSVHLMNLSKLQRMPGKGHLQPISNSVIFVIISQLQFCCEVSFFTWKVLNNYFLYNCNYFWGQKSKRKMKNEIFQYPWRNNWFYQFTKMLKPLPLYLKLLWEIVSISKISLRWESQVACNLKHNSCSPSLLFKGRSESTLAVC